MSAGLPLGDLIRLGLAVAQATHVAPTRAEAGRTLGSVAALAVCLGLATAALACALAALWIFTQPTIGAAGSALVVAGVLLVLCLAILEGVRRVNRRPVPPPPAANRTAALLEIASRMLREHKTSTLFAALLAGFIAGQADE